MSLENTLHRLTVSNEFLLDTVALQRITIETQKERIDQLLRFNNDFEERARAAERKLRDIRDSEHG